MKQTAKVIIVIGLLITAWSAGRWTRQPQQPPPPLQATTPLPLFCSDRESLTITHWSRMDPTMLQPTELGESHFSGTMRVISSATYQCNGGVWMEQIKVGVEE